MAVRKTPKKRSPGTKKAAETGGGGETHQTAPSAAQVLTTNQGSPVSNNQSTLVLGARGPSLLEDHVFREKITHFDHERIPERIVHARGTGAHGYFEPYPGAGKLSRAAFLQDQNERTEVFVRFSTVAGGAGSADLPRDVRGFAVKFYTKEGNFDLVGNNIPVFFIQDAIKFPDLVHSVKMEPDRGYPQSASAHDTFWDFVSLMPESMHMLVWVMSDRAIPRSYRMIEGFGVHTFRMVDARGRGTFVKFHWRPKLGAFSVVWDEALKINGMDPDFHRRDLFEAIARGDFPEYELSVQAFSEEEAARFPFDVLDATKIIPEEVVPLKPIGRMVLDRNVDNFFAETEQVAFHPGNVVPGIDFTNDPLLQGRLFSYVDTQLIRLGGPNFHEIPVNQPRCPMRNFTRDGFKRMAVPKGRVAYEPNSLAPDSPRESPEVGFTSFPDRAEGPKLRVRSETFADHYSQARQFFRSMTDPEQMHIISAFAFELGKVETPAIRRRMLGHLQLIDPMLGNGVEAALGMEGEADEITPAREPIDLDPSPALSIVGKAPKSIAGKKVGMLITDGSDPAVVERVRAAVEKEGATFAVIAPKIGGAKVKGGKKLPADQALSSAPSVFFDAVVLAPSEEGGELLAREAAAIDFVRDAFGHLKVIGHNDAADLLLERAGVERDEGVLPIGADKTIAAFIKATKQGRLWAREPKLRSPG